MAVVNIAVIALRRREPHPARTFRVPLFPLLPLLGVGFCPYLMYETGWTTWLQFAGFLAAGLVQYVLYGRRNSRLEEVTPDAGATAAEPQRV